MTSPTTFPDLLAVFQARSLMRALHRDPGDPLQILASLSETTFRDVVIEEMLRRFHGPVGQTALVPPSGTSESLSDPSVPRSHASPALAAVPPAEAEVVAHEAKRAGIDPDLLAALRRTENGGPGREFGVLSVHAPGLEEQARAAANTIRNTAARFQRLGDEAVDPTSGRYTEAFLRFFSARYAPVGAPNDPNGLNRFHAANLIAVYRRMRGEESSG